MDMLGHQFYMFRDAETEEIAVVYKRLTAGTAYWNRMKMINV